MKSKIFLLDVLPGKLSAKEIEGYLSDNTELIVNTQVHFSLPSQNDSVHQVNIDTNKFREIVAVAEDYGGIDAIKLRKNVPIGPDLLLALTRDTLDTRLKVIAQAGVGLNHIDKVMAESLGIDVFNTPGSNALAVAEFTLLQMLAMLRHSGWHQSKMRRGIWSKTALPPARSLCDVSVGLAGSGAISQALIHLLSPFQMPVTVLGSSRFTDEMAARLGVIRAENIEALLSNNDVISLHLPLNSETYHLINSSVLPLFKTGSYLINTSRGGIVDEKALAQFMNQHPGWIAGTALDTFESEGDHFFSPLQKYSEAFLTPHIAGSTESALINAAIRAQQGILDRLNSGLHET
ncbi:D-3-phosphoglycerate dehydrogenase [Pantoea allii]|uniref:D-3-phosphoglycerate dehydrogenase n=1 Tax=Pantoea allii TaxID=574096 RepID=A0A2V2BCN0_9GAMM|nr:NAD(P)-dependent oxidoreductase [Pantoea allii]PWK94644.1 D-3-phosphoglycerate dehydrogenase [Pantoea allii]